MASGLVPITMQIFLGALIVAIGYQEGRLFGGTVIRVQRCVEKTACSLCCSNMICDSALGSVAIKKKPPRSAAGG